ncbi:hypothetical protein AGMMS50225_08310 [Betaproteobacteria bacterium]|nr:hypothetical protein AGMMS50225_08310 [Betaproteobacteria bacterium]
MNLFEPDLWISFFMLTSLEIVLGVDNIIFLSILVGRLPAAMRKSARRLGLGLAMVTRLALLFTLSWVMGLTRELFDVAGTGFSGRDLVLFAGGVFLLYKASHEIFIEVEARDEGGAPGADVEAGTGRARYWATIVQIALIDIVFSLDSVITAVGMVNQIWVMVAAVVVSVVIMLIAVEPISGFIERHPSVKVLALAFLVMVGTALVAEAFKHTVPKGYLYSAMAFSFAVEALNIRARSKRAALRGGGGAQT